MYKHIHRYYLQCTLGNIMALTVVQYTFSKSKSIANKPIIFSFQSSFPSCHLARINSYCNLSNNTVTDDSKMIMICRNFLSSLLAPFNKAKGQSRDFHSHLGTRQIHWKYQNKDETNDDLKKQNVQLSCACFFQFNCQLLAGKQFQPLTFYLFCDSSWPFSCVMSLS